MARWLAFFLAWGGLLLGWAAPGHARDPGEIGLRDGDLVFQRSSSAQSEAISLATGSQYTHMGVVLFRKGRPMILEAVGPVRFTPFAEWVARGRDGRVAIERLADPAVLTPQRLREMRRLAELWLGRPYDRKFAWDDERLYCSELVYKLYERAAGVRIGRPRRAGDFELGSESVRRLSRERGLHPEELVISPQSMFEDPGLIQVFSNF